MLDPTGLNFLVPENLIPCPENSYLMYTDLPTCQLNTPSINLAYHTPPLGDASTPPSSSISNNSTSDEADDQALGIVDERKRRRMISNRESARRSRMRKQRQLEELWSQVLGLRNENQLLNKKLNHVLESHEHALQENEMLKNETADLRKMINELSLCTLNNAMEYSDAVPCNKSHLSLDSSHP